MADSKVKDGNFISIQSFMVKDLGLKGNELLTYAIIYGFSQDGENEFTGSLQYLCDWTNSAKSGIRKVLKSLCDKGLLIKNDVVVNNVKFCKYKCTPYHKVAGGIAQSGTGGIAQSGTNTIDINTIDNKYSAFEKNFEDIWKLYPNKRGKGQVSKSKKKELYEIGIEQLERCIQRYLKELKKDEWRKPQNGSTFFNSGYVDYLDENYQEPKKKEKIRVWI